MVGDTESTEMFDRGSFPVTVREWKRGDLKYRNKILI